MKKFFPIVSLLIITSVALISSINKKTDEGTERDKNYVYWDERQVSWDDFKGKVPSSSPYEAITWSAIRFSYGGIGDELNITVETIFDPKQSWKTKNVNDHILNHEQRHFDITEVFARILRKDLLEKNFSKYETLDDEISKLFQTNFDDCEKMQDKYDAETDHSKNKEIQTTWDQKISHMLDSLNDWSGTEYRLNVGYLLTE
ncbi:MAG: DUF922 domain-containing protein [Crocinitomicaceae bacterium]|nr:DUF922 domain-containing protein [Crocinitomicaceae bacterium]